MNLNDLKQISIFALKTIVPIVGIGTNTPTAKLEVSSGVANTSGLKFTNFSSTSPTGTGQAVGVDASGNLITVASGGGSTSLSGLTSATAISTLSNANYAQTWSWQTLTTQTAFSLNSATITSGTLLNLTGSNNSATDTGTGIQINGSSGNWTGVNVTMSNNAAAGVATGFKVTNNTGAGLGLDINMASNTATSTTKGLNIASGAGAGQGALITMSNNGVTDNTGLKVTSVSSGSLSNSGLFEMTNTFATGTTLKSTQAGTGDAFAATANSGRAAYLSSTSGHALIVGSGSVGIGTATPAEKLHVNGNVRSSGQLVAGFQEITSGATANLDWNNGNSISTNYNCASPFSFANLQAGGTYTLVVTDTGTTQCNFSTTTTGTGAGTVSYRFKPANAARTTTSHSIYTLMRVGNVVYVSWGSGF